MPSMGVTGLWQILQPCARPIKIETLNRKRLAVDASIWIYQFLKAVRDKEGNALRNSHVVGFFRRICKLLFFGIKPVFVFDGGAPALKRQTIMGRKRRREGRREDAVRTAGKLLAVQMQRRAEQEQEAQRRRVESGRARARGEGEGAVEEEEEAVAEEGLVYVDELQMSAQERQQNRRFRKKDAYHLPELDVGLHEMGGPNDPRVMSLEELEQYARQFDTGEGIDVYDFSKIDYDSPFFQSLPASDRYNILNAARLRSRLRMGHSKEQLDSMFPDRMAFSRFQIDRVRERNELTTRLMNINDGDIQYAHAGTNRVAGEKAREYVLVKNDGVEGGWALGVISDEGTKRETAIDLDKPAQLVKEESSEDEADGFEDVPIEGLNRLPKRRKVDDDATGQSIFRQRAAFQRRRGGGARRKPRRPAVQTTRDPDSLFVADETAEEVDGGEDEEEWEDAGLFTKDGEPAAAEDEDEELRRAIAMSLEQDGGAPAAGGDMTEEQVEREDWYQSFQQRAAEEARPIPKGSARAIANILNKRANASAPESRGITSFGVPVPKPDSPVSTHSDEDGMDFQAALAESRQSKRKTTPPLRRQPGTSTQTTASHSDISGPLPFERLDLGSSLLGRKKAAQRAQAVEGGFERAEHAEKEARKVEPLPSWFSGDLEEGIRKQERLEREEREKAREYNERFHFEKRGAFLKRMETGEVIDLEAEDGEGKGEREVIILDDEEGGGTAGVAPELMGVPVDDEVRMGDVAEVARVEPPVPEVESSVRSLQGGTKHGPFELEDSDVEEVAAQPAEDAQRRLPKPAQAAAVPKLSPTARKAAPFMDEEGDEGVEAGAALNVAPPAPVANDDRASAAPLQEHDEDEGDLDWSASEDERPTKKAGITPDAAPAGGVHASPLPTRSAEMEFEDVRGDRPSPAKSPSPAFEDVDMSTPPPPRSPTPRHPSFSDSPSAPAPASGSHLSPGLAPTPLPEDETNEFDDFSDPEEEELLKALTLEAEEHARFASTLNQKSTAQNIAEYEKELKQLRNQQKKDRRDADEVTHIMVQECQQLLRLFGLPYVTAPMEAEAQCAELVRLGLVDGIVTDDSDCFLFGGTRIYKNMFNQAKFVECYLASDLEKEFDLTRDKLIAVAQLLGSDYTEGLPGVGPVTALEILSEFDGDLGAFREWVGGVQLQMIPKEVDAGNAFRKKFRKQAVKILLPPSFPDPRVSLAYERPEVDSDPEAFQWGVPDLEALRSFLMATIGWSAERTDEVLVPVIRDMNRREEEGTQSNITRFFEGGVGVGAAGTVVNGRGGDGFAPRKREQGSKRMGKALGKLAERAKVQRRIGQGLVVDGGEQGVDMSAIENGGLAAADVAEGGVGSASKPRRRKRAPGNANDDASEEEASEFESQPKKKGRKKAAPASKGRKKKSTVLGDD